MSIPISVLRPMAGMVGRIGWIIASIFLFAIFTVAGLTALYFHLRESLPPAEAMGLIAVLAGFASLVAGWWATTRDVGPKHDGVSEAAMLEAMLRQTIAKDPLGAALGALAAGVVLESVPELGHLVRRFLSDRS